VEQVDHLTFSGAQARKNRQEVRYVTDKAVFELQANGLCLLEIAPGLDPVADILDHIPFKVSVAQPIGRMPADIFEPSVKPFRLLPSARRTRGNTT
jgi:propionate CoA-transferase